MSDPRPDRVQRLEACLYHALRLQAAVDARLLDQAKAQPAVDAIHNAIRAALRGK